jgi:CheY-like chemotaxis protein
MRVLIVEDEARIAKPLAASLGDAGYAVDCAGDGARADFLAQTENYDADRARSGPAEDRRADADPPLARRAAWRCRSWC